MSDEKKTVASRLWRDRVQIREQERNEALPASELPRRRWRSSWPRTIG